MSSLNKIILIGNLGNDPEIRNTSDGRKIANFSIATSEKWKDKITGDIKEKTEWHKVVVFNEVLVENIKNYIKKGSKIYVEGKLQTRKWLDQAGHEKYTTEVILQGFNASIIFLDSKDYFSRQEIQSTAPSSKDIPVLDNMILDDEIPF